MSDQLATYTFLPWVRQGIASRIIEQDNLGIGAGTTQRASVKISLEVNGDPNFVSPNVQIIGPGDVIGISPRAIVRTEPRNWVTDFESNYLAFIEFYEEDFPWRFTPARAADSPRQTKLRPWLFLLVLEEGEFKEVHSRSEPLPVIELADTVDTAKILPPPDQAWAWAHVHVSRDITSAGDNTSSQSLNEFETLVRQNPDYAFSRLICPRKLRPSTPYHAFLIPAFELGRLAGLGQEPAEQTGMLDPSWGKGQTEYPVYYRWYFRTGERGDFEYLVNLLEPREVDARIGIRNMDMQAPNFGARGMSTGANDIPVMGLEGALKSPQAVPKPEVWPPGDSANYPAFLNDLEKMVNLQETLHSEEETYVQEMLLSLQDPATRHPDPIISPPLHGRWHALQTLLKVGQPGWVNELNQDPRLRVPAGFGTKVVQVGQEGYTQRAWQQLGDVLRANQKIRQVQISIASSMRMYARHFVQLDPEEQTAMEQIAITRQVHARVMGSPITVYQQLRESRLEGAALNPAFRRVFRPRGAIMRKALPPIRGQTSDILVKLNQGSISAAGPKGPPKSQISLNTVDVDELHEENLTAAGVSRIKARPEFRISLPVRELPPLEPPTGVKALGPFDKDSREGGDFRSTLGELHGRLEISLPAPEPRPKAKIGEISERLVEALNPKTTILHRARSVISIPDTFKYLRATETIVPVMAHPVFADPMYKPLRDLSSELLIPNLHLIPNNTITLLETNPRFMEAYMVGLNHEMARELLWREYPTDQRGSYFRQFWDVGEVVNRNPMVDAKEFEESLRDIEPLHRWTRDSHLGGHAHRDLPVGNEKPVNNEPSDERKLVLVIRGDLLRRYPTAVIFAQAAKWVGTIRKLNEAAPHENIKEPIFKAQIEPDLYFLGFDLTIDEAKGDATPPANRTDLGKPGWFFVIQERPGEPRFGLDLLDHPITDDDKITEWNQLSWDHLGDPETMQFIDLSTIPDETNITTNEDKNINWGSNAADMAYILFQVPAMVAIHAANMLS